MNKVVEEGTGKRAMLDGIKAAGKTGTTNGYRDAWFVGFTGNYVGGVWFGNDDYSSTNRMTGGALPAMTWRQIMAYAHQGIELKTIAGVAPGPIPTPPVAAVADAAKNAEAPQRPAVLTRRGAEALTRVERLMEEATRSLATSERPMPSAPGSASTSSRRPGPFAAASQPPPAAGMSGN
jgi:penicillin-binding protein 1A